MNEECVVLNFKLVEFVTSFVSTRMCSTNVDLGFHVNAHRIHIAATKYAQVETEIRCEADGLQ